MGDPERLTSRKHFEQRLRREKKDGVFKAFSGVNPPKENLIL